MMSNSPCIGRRRSVSVVACFRKTSLFHFAIALAFALCAVNGRAQVVINEIMFHPSSHNPREEYVELLNTAATNVNLSGWKFTKGFDFTFPTNTILKPSTYLVIAGNGQAFTNKYPTVTNYVGEFVVVRMTNLNGFTLTNFENTLSNTREELKPKTPRATRLIRSPMRRKAIGDYASAV